MTYNAIVAELHNVQPIEGAHSLAQAIVCGNQVVVGINSKDGDLGLYYSSDGKLSEEFARENNLFKSQGGYFDDNNPRVRAQRFRGVKSDGFFIGLSSLAYTGFDLSKLEVGNQLSELNGHVLCEKWINPQTLRGMNQGQKTARAANKFFAKHVDTRRLDYEIDDIQEGSLIYISEKIHGSSQRVGHVLDDSDRKVSWWKKFRGKDKPEYKILHGTRNVVLTGAKLDSSTSFYGDESFRFDSTRRVSENLHKGEIVYGEIVGWLPDGRAIMGEQSTKELKEIKKQYGSSIVYSYGNVRGTCEFHVYRITRVNEEGIVTELSWQQVKARCMELGVKHVLEMHPPFIYDGNAKWLREEVDYLLEGPSLLDESHIREGVVLRVEHLGHTTFYKSKSYSFKVLEGQLKDTNFIDLEESS